jgi:eukaryotic-like serine/threonine-protein kinase
LLLLIVDYISSYLISLNEMTPERWQQVNELFHSALEREPAQRAAFLDQACADDQELRKEVESLIGSNENTDSFIDAPAFEADAPLLAEDKTDLAAGQHVGHYKIISLLGSGGMGEVYLAQDSKLGRKVALKLLPASLTKDEERVRRFEQEARAASALNHPNILTIFDIDQADSHHFIVAEYIEGKTLREHIADRSLKPSGALDLATQVASALSAAHQAGIVHRDIKPENIMLRPDGYVKVLDFGLAKLTEVKAAGTDTQSPAFQAVKTNTGMRIGTVSYMSPEQAKAQHVDQRSDVFSFGVVLYEMLTGERAFRRDSDIDTLHAIIHEEPPRLPALRGMVPAGVERVLRQCLEKEPEARYASGIELLAALKPLMAPSGSNFEVPAPSRGTWPRWLQRWWIALAGVVVLVSGSVWLRFSRHAGDAESKPARGAPVAAMSVVPLASVRGEVTSPRFSPDGKQVAFTWRGEGNDNWDIYVKLIDGGAQKRLTVNPDADGSPVWSPDGQYLAFNRVSENERSIITIPILGSPERKLYTAKRSWVGREVLIDWSPTGESIAYTDSDAPERPLGICLLEVATRESRQLTSPPEGWYGDTQPAFSQDGQMLAFVRWSVMSGGAGEGDLYVMAVAGGEPRRLTFDNKSIAGLTWTPDGRSIVFASTRDRLSQLWRIPATGGEPERLGIGSDNALRPAISRQGQRLAYASTNVASSMWRLDLSAPPGKAPPPTKLFSATAWEAIMQISPDAKRIAFTSNRSGTYQVWVCDSDGSNMLQLASLGSVAGTPRWSPDGRFIAFDARIEGQFDIYLIGADGGPPRRLTDNPTEDMVPSWSRDGRWIYFGSNRNGDFQVWKIHPEGGDAVQVTRAGGLLAFESRDGRYVYYQKGLDASELWRLPVEGGEEQLLCSIGFRRNNGVGGWALADDGVYFTETVKKEVRDVIEFYSFATRRVTQIRTLGWVNGIALSPDGRWLLYAQRDDETGGIMLVENFR